MLKQFNEISDNSTQVQVLAKCANFLNFKKKKNNDKYKKNSFSSENEKKGNRDNNIDNE